MKDTNARKIIKYNKGCIEKIKQWIDKEINPNKRMDLIEFYLHFCTNNVTGIYSDPWIEKKIIEYSSKIEFHAEKATKKNTVLVVMTVASGIGGHTALINNWIRFDKNKTYTIVLTDCPQSVVPDFLIKTVKESGGEIYHLKSTVNLDKAEELLHMAQSFQYIILNIHMYDMVPIIAFGHKNWEKPVYFYNHADFLFSIGMSVSDVVFTLNQYDNKRAKENRGAARAEILPFPQSEAIYKKSEKSVEILKEEMGRQYGFKQDSSIILSMGSDFKFVRTEQYDFESFVERILKKAPDNTYFIIIGANPKARKWKMMQKKTNNHAQALGFLDRQMVSNWMKIADAYVTSFPMTAAGASEARANNVTNFRFSPSGRSNEYFPKEEIYDTIEELESAVIKSLKDNEKKKYEMPECSRVSGNAKEWCALLDKLLNTVDKHEVYNFKNIPILENQEIINVQLLSSNNYPYGRTRRLGLIKWIKIKWIYARQKWMYCKYNIFYKN